MKPSDMPHRKLAAVRTHHDTLDAAIRDVEHVMHYWLTHGHTPDVAAHLTQITLDQTID